MIRLEPVSPQAARTLIDFGGGGALIAPDLAEQQLDGAVALYNALGRERVAYIADEVGLGKTYVALGAVGLLRYFHPHARVLFITPRENIQRKWLKELRNFAARNWRHADQRVRDFRGLPARPAVHCTNLIEFAQQMVSDPDRDFFTRLTSFSFALGGDAGGWAARRDALCRLSASVDRDALDLRQDKDSFKRAVARTLNGLLPHFDLVVVDEAHNLKGGIASGAARNQLLSLILGSAREGGVTPRCDRVLLLSATPLESDYMELWNQLDLFGLGKQFQPLADPAASEGAKQEVASRFLFRRVTTLRFDGREHTKNQYRREWRAGGCVVHDEPLRVPDARQRLIVALVQKKVAEVLQDPEFNASFQIGMLASFESFLQTAKVESTDGETAVFDQADQTANEIEREGLDRLAVNSLASSYRRVFGQPLPHPKMDALVQSLAATIPAGQKTLVFVRRVMSVPELAEKLCRTYDDWLIPRLRERLGPGLAKELEPVVRRYEEERRRASWDRLVTAPSDETTEAHGSAETEEESGQLDRGGRETFFSWFFRGEGPQGILSGAAFQKNRLRGEGSAYSTFFEDNHVATLLGERDDVLAALARVLRMAQPEIEARLRSTSFAIFRATSQRKDKGQPRRRVFLAYQAAALHLLAESSTALAEDARVMLRESMPGPVPTPGETPRGWPGPSEHLATRTLFTELRRRESLCDDIWPVRRDGSFAERFRDAERRRELLSAVARLGHAFIDLWILAVRRLGSLALKSQERRDERAEALIDEYLDLLEEQRTSTEFTAWRELREVGQHHELILGMNFPEARSARLGELARMFGSALGSQMPIGGMWGGVNKSLVGQFRMPGYPLVLVTTDVLQEGEDLHAFCSRVVHYGITWTPSAMEQRTGRVDRIASLTHRRLTVLGEKRAHPDEMLQVYYPYLEDTVEVLQVDRVLDRMNRFLRLMHEGLGEKKEERSIDTRESFAHSRVRVPPITEKLTTAFPVRDSDRKGRALDPAEPAGLAQELEDHLREIQRALPERVRVDWEPDDIRGELCGRVHVAGQELLRAGATMDRQVVREQAIRLSLRTHGAEGVPALHAESPVGVLDLASVASELLDVQAGLEGVKVCTVPWSGAAPDLVTVEGDLFFGKRITQMNEVEDLIRRVAVGADEIEREFFDGRDASPAEYWDVLRRQDHDAD